METTTPTLTTEPKELKLWCEQYPRLQLAWDSTSLRDFMTCPRLYQYKMVEGWVPKKMAPALKFGISYHRGLEVYEHGKALGKDFNTSLREGIRAALDEWGDYQSDDNRRNQFTLVRSIVWYADKFINDPAKTLILQDGSPAVELSFRIAIPLTAPGGSQYILCGHIDRIVEIAGIPRVSDYKTTVSTLSSQYFSSYDLDVQMDLYDFFGNIAMPEMIQGLLIDGAQTAVNFSRYARGLSDRKPDQREEFFKDLIYWIKQAENCAMLEDWPMNKTSCSKFGGCTFREVCKRSPSVRKMVLESEFKVDQWNPLNVRGVK